MTGLPDPVSPNTPKWAAAVFGVLQVAAQVAPASWHPYLAAASALAGWFGIHTASKTSE